MKKVIFFFFLISVLIKGNAQQDPMFTQYAFNTLTINPAYSGTTGHLTAIALTRWQWVGIDGAPVTNTLTIHSPIKNKRLGVGLSIVQDNIGPTNQLYGYLDLAYHLPLTRKHTLSFGIKGGMTNFWTNLEELEINDDPNLSGAKLFKTSPNIGSGLYLHHEKFYIGFSIPKMLEPEFTSDNNTFRPQRHYFLIGGYIWDISPYLAFRPTALFKAVEGSPMGLDITPSFLLNRTILIGSSIRSDRELSVLLQVWPNEQLRIGYAYDFPLSSLNVKTFGTHELMVSYDFSFTNQSKKVYSPRFF